MATLGKIRPPAYDDCVPTTKIFWGAIHVGMICWHDWPTDEGDIPFGEAEIFYFDNSRVEIENEYCLTIKDGEHPGDFYARVMQFVNAEHLAP